jgi:hypothetical protein
MMLMAESSRPNRFQGNVWTALADGGTNPAARVVQDHVGNDDLPEAGSDRVSDSLGGDRPSRWWWLGAAHRCRRGWQTMLTSTRTALVASVTRLETEAFAGCAPRTEFQREKNEDCKGRNASHVLDLPFWKA